MRSPVDTLARLVNAHDPEAWPSIASLGAPADGMACITPEHVLATPALRA